MLVAMFMDFQWSFGGQFNKNGVLEEQDGDVLGVSRPLPCGLASGHWCT